MERSTEVVAPRTFASWLSDWVASACLAALYIGTIELMAFVFLHDPNETLNPRFAEELHGWAKDARSLPSLCRWDCIWYVNIAEAGYPGTRGDSVYNAAFFPLFGVLMRWGSQLFHLPVAYVAVWITRACLPFTLTLVRDFVRLSGDSAEAGWAACAVLLLAPESCIMVAGVADGLFLLLTVAAIVLAKRGRVGWAMVPAFLAGLTRVHAFAFVVGLAGFGLGRWLEGPRTRAELLTVGRLKAFAPALSCGLAIASLGVYLGRTLGDPLAFIHQQDYFGKPTLDPLHALSELPDYWRLFPPETPDALLDWMRLPIACAVFGSSVFFAVKRRWFELAYTAALNAMLLLSTLWGVGRYMVMVFPVCIAVSQLRRWRPIWYGLLFSGAIVQAYVLLQFVLLRRAE